MSDKYSDLTRTAYPNKIDARSTNDQGYNVSTHLIAPDLAINQDNVSIVLADDVNVLQDGVIAVQRVLGPSPEGASATVAARLTSLDGSISTLTGHTHIGGGGNPSKIDLVTHVAGNLLATSIQLTYNTTNALTGAGIAVNTSASKTISTRLGELLPLAGGTLTGKLIAPSVKLDGAAPSPAAEGDIYFDSSVKQVRVYANGAWGSLGGNTDALAAWEGQNCVSAGSSNYDIVTDSTAWSGSGMRSKTGLGAGTMFLSGASLANSDLRYGSYAAIFRMKSENYTQGGTAPVATIEMRDSSNNIIASLSVVNGDFEGSALYMPVVLIVPYRSTHVGTYPTVKVESAAKITVDSIILLPANTGLVSRTRSIATSGSLTGGGNLSADRTITHLTTAGHKHIPTAGAAGQGLTYSSEGTAQWQTLVWLNAVQTWTANQAMNAVLNVNQTSGRLVVPVGTDKYATA